MSSGCANSIYHHDIFVNHERSGVRHSRFICLNTSESSLYRIRGTMYHRMNARGSMFSVFVRRIVKIHQEWDSDATRIGTRSASLKASSIHPSTLDDGLIVFPEKVALQIDDFAFSRCIKLWKLPEGLLVIEPWLFRGCQSLATVKMPSSVIKICEQAFHGCQSLSSLEIPDGLLELGDGSFEYCRCIKTLCTPSSVSSIGKSAFRNCSGLEHIKLPPALERIENSTFEGCHSLAYIKIPSTVSFIGRSAFCDCYSLSHLRIPPGVNCIVHRAFERCINLISIELPEQLLIGHTEQQGFAGISRCSSLVNVAILTRTEDLDFMGGFVRNMKLGSIVDDDSNLVRKLKHRFANSPLNKLCYYQSYYSSDDAMVQLRRLMGEDPLAATAQVDEFGMTPLHVLSLSQSPNLDMLLAVMNKGHPDHIFQCRDFFGSTPLDYLCLNRMPNSTKVIRRVVETRVDRLSSDQWKSEMLLALDEALAVRWSSRRREIGRVYFKLASYDRKEVLSLLELCLWKIKIDELSSKEQRSDRESCQINCGASIVIPHVLPFLGEINLED
eukprot:scaffold6247_cov104-Cylindrotheca_fusiformis.AAC.5